jgi:hypothetical protein
MDLLGILCFSIRDFSGALLSTAGMDIKQADGLPPVGSLNFVLWTTLNEDVRPKPTLEDSRSHQLLSEAVLTLIEGLLCNVTDDLADRLVPFIQCSLLPVLTG